MSHIRVYLVYKENENPEDIIYNNSNNNIYEDSEPFGYDYLTIESEPKKVSKFNWDFNKVGAIINNEEEIYCCSWSTPCTIEEYNKIVKSLNKDDLFVICDGHL